MTNLLPLFNSTNRFRSSSEGSKRKCAVLAQKAAPTCILSLTSVSVSAHGSSDSFSSIPFPSAPTTTPFPSEPISIPTSSSSPPSNSSSAAFPPRTRVRSQASLLRRKRSTARPVQPCTDPCSSQAESEPDQVSSTPPRKRARKASISCPSTSSSTSSPGSSFHSLAISSHPQRKGKASKKAAADLRYLCTIYRSIAWLRLQRDFSEASRCLVMNAPGSMDVDTDIDIGSLPVSVLDAQESLLMSRLRSYLIFNEMNPQWLDVTPLHSDPFVALEAGTDMDVDVQESHSAPTSSVQQQTLPQLPIMSSEQVIASLLFRYRHRSKGKSKPEAPVAEVEEVPVKMRRRSPLAGSWAPEEPL